ncbi:MAG: TetR/AcrR family transcriptional regulator [Hamadaea sp.]|uniref:TetR/AcrR family transcriptional regulator n=1 Tax=Hamadaea sp. NPDC050747 TaxID=3155789 RepID=UPI00185BB7D7|nr:TetR/AcrR family transcriptional regulator [Hamadaea sp.]NUR49593.1 TetR/AcrR family transcriptional regulator [Hamadaea sp.]NUT06430.1 TetR/AcrR family transcriptional regulator [Hamadaea sp.]
MAQTRDVILDAALTVIRERGLGKATTKAIAQEAGFSEAALYKHFADKEEIFLGVLQERSPGFPPLHAALAAKPGSGTVEGNLIAIATAAMAFYHENFPLLGSIFAERRVFETHRARLSQKGAGPHKVNQVVAGYLSGEQQAGRVRADADVAAAADLLMGCCFQHAFLCHYQGRPVDRAAAERYVRTLLPGLG